MAALSASSLLHPSGRHRPGFDTRRLVPPALTRSSGCSLCFIIQKRIGPLDGRGVPSAPVCKWISAALMPDVLPPPFLLCRPSPSLLSEHHLLRKILPNDGAVSAPGTPLSVQGNECKNTPPGQTFWWSSSGTPRRLLLGRISLSSGTKLQALMSLLATLHLLTLVTRSFPISAISCFAPAKPR